MPLQSHACCGAFALGRAAVRKLDAAVQGRGSRGGAQEKMPARNRAGISCGPPCGGSQGNSVRAVAQSANRRELGGQHREFTLDHCDVLLFLGMSTVFLGQFQCLLGFGFVQILTPDGGIG